MERKALSLTEEFYYDTEEEREEHKKYMIDNGYEWSGQLKENIGINANTEYKLYGRFFKQNKGDIKVGFNKYYIAEIKNNKFNDKHKAIIRVTSVRDDFFIYKVINYEEDNIYFSDRVNYIRLISEINL